MADIKDDVLRILATQSPDYLIWPDAAAFAVEGHAPEDVAAVLAELEQDGHARQDEIVLMTPETKPDQTVKLDKDGKAVLDKSGAPVMVDVKNAAGETVMVPVLDGDGVPVLVEQTDAKGNPVTLDAGWCVTAQGVKLHAKNAKARDAADTDA